jgi:hypothetical protein
VDGREDEKEKRLSLISISISLRKRGNLSHSENEVVCGSIHKE